MEVHGFTEAGSIDATIDGVRFSVPDNMANRHRQMIAEWEAEGNIIPAYVPPPPEPEPVPDEISDRQFFQQLAVLGVITQQEALAAVATGTIPSAMAALIDQLPEAQQFPAQMLVSGATTFRRSHPISGFIGGLYGWTDEQADDLWLAAALL